MCRFDEMSFRLSVVSIKCCFDRVLLRSSVIQSTAASIKCHSIKSCFDQVSFDHLWFDQLSGYACAEPFFVFPEITRLQRQKL